MKQETIHITTENLIQTTGIQFVWHKTGELDGEVAFTVNGKKYVFIIDVKHEIRIYQLQQIQNDFQQHKNYLLVANRIFPKIKEELRLKEIPYIEANGNIFLKTDDVLLFVDSQKPLATENNKTNRAFTKTGLKVLFYLLQHKEAINLTQRKLAEKTGVALGNIPQVIGGLKETGFLTPLNNKTYVWENRAALLERWIAEYASVLRPKLRKERYKLKGNWQDIEFNTNKTLWGGEAAADILTNYLRPEKFIIYTTENRKDLIRNYKLMPDKNGDIEVLEMFWKQKNGKTVPPLLVYADLLLEGGKRNRETADKIYEEHIQPNL